MDIYTYVALANPYQAKAIIHKYGYSSKNVKNQSDLGICLKKVVAYEGENAFNDVLDSHPDRNVLIEKYNSENKKEANFSNANGSGCGCKSNQDMQYMNFVGNENQNKNSSKEIGIIIIASALLLASAIIVKK
jgi:hypothetical protein